MKYFVIFFAMAGFLMTPCLVLEISALCMINEDWSDAPCFSGRRGEDPSLNQMKQSWAPYYEFKGAEWMEVKKQELMQTIQNGNLIDWKKGDLDGSHHNVYMYYFLKGDIPNEDGLFAEEYYGITFLSPLHQRESGITLNNIRCGLDLVLIQKYDGSPSCVMPETAEKLIERGWANNVQKINKIFDEDSTHSKILAIYGILDEEKNWNIISSSLDGQEKEVLATFNFTGNEGQRPRYALDIVLSPNGEYFLYSFPKSSFDSLWLVNTDTKEQRLVVQKEENQRLSQYFWSPDSKKFTYSLQDLPPPCPNCGMPAYQINGPWYVYDIENNTHEMIREKTRSLALMGWWNNDNLLFTEFDLFIKNFPLTIYEINSKKSSFLITLEQIPTVVINQNERTKFFSFMIVDNICDILIINPSYETSYNIQEENVSCHSNYNPNFWLSDDGSQMIYGRGTSPSGGPIGWPDIDENNVYLISSIYLMDLETQRQESVFEGKVNGPYYILGGWNSEHDVLAYAKLQVNSDETVFSLMISDSDGNSPVKIDEIRTDTGKQQREIPFYGWKIPEN
jgi:hypothetical protein